MMSKFRAWRLANGGSMHQVSSLDFNEDGDLSGVIVINSKEPLFRERILPENCVLMQSTSLKDLNGVEIYEGDILEGVQWLSSGLPHSITGTVRYDLNGAKFIVTNIDGAYFICNLGDTVYELEIIGNIYGNPELLEVAK